MPGSTRLRPRTSVRRPPKGARPLERFGGDDPAQVVLRQEHSDRVRSAVASLDEPYREVVALRFFGELSLAEIAMTSGRPIGTVKTHLHRGLLRLRSTLEAES